MNDNGYLGVTDQTTQPLTTREIEISGLLDAIMRAEDAAQNAEDCERYSAASKHRAASSALRTQLEALRGGK